MRYLCIVLAVLGLPITTAAQNHQSGSLPSIGLPLPAIGLPLPSLGLPPLQPVPGVSRPETVHPDFAPAGRRSHLRPSPIYVVNPYPWMVTNPFQVGPSVAPPPPTPPAPQAQPERQPPLQPATGRLRLEVEPAELAQVFVDGVFAGTLDDLGHEIDLKPGTRRIEIRARGYKTLVFDTQIVAERTITYRATLERDPSVPLPPPVAAAAPAGSRTIYFIPGCYLGNVPPNEVKLPAGCDLSKLRASTP